MTREPSMPSGAAPEPRVDEIAPGVPIEFDDARSATLAWDRDAVHMPAALTPLAGDYALVLGYSLNQQYPLREGGFPQRRHAAVWHGYVYYAFERNATDDEWAAIEARIEALISQRALVTESYWSDEVLPELHSIYARLDAIDAEQASGAAVAAAWESGWRGAERAWELHMEVTPGIFWAQAELAKAYAAAVSGASRGDGTRLVLGSETDLFRMDRATDELATLASATPAVRDALRSGVRSLAEIEHLEGGPAFVAAVASTLTVHGHLGQLADDLEMPSFGEQPDLFVAEIAKRLDRTGPAAEERRRRLRAEADALAGAARARLSGDPDALARFDAALDLGRRIGSLSEGHNYWIDRAVLAHLRRLVMRVGARLVRDGVVDRPDDVLYLRRTEVGDLLREPREQRAVVDRRREEHAADKRIRPASRVGATTAAGDHVRFSSAGEPAKDAVIKGTGASPGIVRGPARVVLDVEGFARVHAGDIIVCHASNPSFVPILAIAAGLVATVGGILSHGAVVAREFGVPAVVGVADATSRIADGQPLEIDGTTGTITLL